MGEVGKFNPETGYFKKGIALRTYKRICLFCEKNPLDKIGHDVLLCRSCDRRYALRPLTWVSFNVGRPSNEVLARRKEQQEKELNNAQ